MKTIKAKMTATRHHDFCAGHRVVGHENKCKHLHGHNYRVHFTCEAEQLDSVGRVIDFGVIKEKLCTWLDDNYDHKFLVWEKDDAVKALYNGGEIHAVPANLLDMSIVWLDFNPTAENIAKHLVEYVGPVMLKGTGVTLIKVVVEETAKCSATYELIK